MSTHSASEIEAWIVRWLSEELEVSADEIDVDDAFVNLGVGSRQAVFLSSELEDEFNITLDPSLAWDYPTIAKLSTHLAEQMATA